MLFDFKWFRFFIRSHEGKPERWQLGMTDDTLCTCHPDDNPPRPCPRKYALSDCRAAAE